VGILGHDPLVEQRPGIAARAPVAELVGSAGLMSDGQLQRGIARVAQPPGQAHHGRR
jgi:hypothetical protein